MSLARRLLLITIVVVASTALTVVLLNLQRREDRLYGPGTGGAGWLLLAAVIAAGAIALCAQISSSGVTRKRRQRHILATWRIIAVVVGLSFFFLSRFVLTPYQAEACGGVRNLGTYVAADSAVYNVWPNGARTLRDPPPNVVGRWVDMNGNVYDITIPGEYTPPIQNNLTTPSVLKCTPGGNP
jgi:hypothetical protein